MRATTDIWSIVPVKAFNLAKQRLALVYPPEVRRGLAQAMLEDVLDTLSKVSRISGIAVVTPDPEAAYLALRYGAEVFDEGAEGGLNEAVRTAANRLVRAKRGGMMMLAGDIPGITAEEVETLLTFHGERRGLTVVPDYCRKGTNAFVMTPPDAMATVFGVNSFTRHLQAARIAGLAPMVLSLPHIERDLDHPQDVARFARAPSHTRTWQYLKSKGLIAAGEGESIA